MFRQLSEKERFDEICEIIKTKLNDPVKIFNTICSATEVQDRKKPLKFPQRSDKMIVIGDKKSSNTQKLYEICKKNCQKYYNIETISDLVLNNFDKNDKIGITAGASTPPAIIKEVIGTMSEAQTMQ